MKLSPHRLSALFVFLAAFTVYAMTMAPSVSFWDCGEFATVSKILGVPHPPGVPLFILLMHIFTMLPISPDNAVRCTYMVVLCGSLATMLAYLITVRLIRHIRGVEQSVADQVITYGGGIIGALCLAWSYSMWFNSVESILWTPSLLCTTLNVWLALVWYEKADQPGSERYLLLIAYVIGLAIGVHLLSVLAIPTVALIVHFRRKKLALKSFLGVIALGALSTFAVYPGVVKYLVMMASRVGTFAPVTIIVALIALFWWSVKNKHGILGAISGCALLVIVGYSTYGLIYIRSKQNPAVDENHPATPASFFSYLNREQYGDRPFLPRVWNNGPEYHSESDFFWRYQINKMYLRYLWWQFIGREGAPDQEFQNAGVTPNYTPLKFVVDNPTGVLRLLAILTCVPFILGLTGIVSQFMRDKQGWLIVSALFFVTGLAIVIYLNQDDPQPRDRDYSYVASFFAFTIWIGIGAAAVLEWFAKKFEQASSRHLIMVAAAIGLFLLAPATLMARNYRMNDRSGNNVAFDYISNMLNSCEPNAVLVTNGDNDTFQAWYMQEVEHVRRDVRIVNLSLLNTGWYIKQLRDREPRVPVSFSDAYIDRYLDGHDSEALLQRYWPPEKQKVELDTPEGKMVWTMPATMYVQVSQDEKSRQNNFLRVEDIMLLDFLRTNYDKSKWPNPKPIYFAVTCANSNMIGLRDYLTFDGLVFKITPQKNVPMDADAVRRNFLSVFKGHFRGINDPKVHYDDNVEKLLQNYRSGFLQLAYYYSTQPDTNPQTTLPSGPANEVIKDFDKLSSHQKALAVMNYMDELIPESVRPISNPELSVQIGRMYSDLGHPEEYRQRIEAATARKDLTLNDRLRLASYWAASFDDTVRAKKLIKDALGEDLTAEQAYGVGREMFGAGAYGMAATYFQKCLTANPDDGQAVGGLLQCYQTSGDLAAARTLLGTWVQRHPNDKSAKQRLDQLSGAGPGEAVTPSTLN